MLSFEKLNELIILVLTFGIIYWFQSVDDKKRCKKRVGIYENIKLPLLVTSGVGLILFWESDGLLASTINTNNTKINASLPNINQSLPKTNLLNQAGGSNNFDIPKLPALSEFLPQNKFYKIEADFLPSKPEFDVYTEMPEW